MPVVANKLIQRNPYETLGLSHDATPTQIKKTYHKLALQYHPDRQTHLHAYSKKIDKFTEVAAAYALLSDPVRKREYDYLYKLGAFDSTDNGEPVTTANSGTTTMNSRYTENYSGGYYTKPQAKEEVQSSKAAPFYRSMSSASHDSFFDDLITSSSSKKSFSSPQAARPGIGFSFTPLGKHLSIHVPSRNEIVMNMARGEQVHNFGTRITYSTQQVVANSDNMQKNGFLFLCSASDLSSKKYVSRITRIAKGRQRVVKRTAILHPDGKKEMVIEEDGIIRRRYVEDIYKDVRKSRDTSNPSCSNGHEGKEDVNWYSVIIRGIKGINKLCFASCGPELATVSEQDL